MRNNSFLVGIIVLALFLFLFRPADPLNDAKIIISIPPDTSARTIEKMLKASNLLSPHSIFRLVVRGFNLQNKLKAGDYIFSPAEPLPNILAKLVAGKTVPREEIKVTFPEGTSIYKMSIILKNAGYKNWTEFQGLINEGVTAARRERHWNIFKYIPSESLEGYLFPDTYQFLKKAPVDEMVEVMIGRFDELVMQNWDKWKEGTNLSLHEIITLASIVEKEAKLESERSTIASVFYNRLKLGMLLAADPTIKYALENPSKKVYLNQLAVNSLYNTYKRKGLPLGPICNPGLKSIKAVIYPARTNYYFFVAKQDGAHIFSKRWQEHQRARATLIRFK